MALPIYTHIPNIPNWKGLTKICFKLSCPKGNLCGGGGGTVLNLKYPRLLSGDTITQNVKIRYLFCDPSLTPIEGGGGSEGGKACPSRDQFFGGFLCVTTLLRNL